MAPIAGAEKLTARARPGLRKSQSLTSLPPFSLPDPLAAVAQNNENGDVKVPDENMSTVLSGSVLQKDWKFPNCLIIT